MIYYAARFTVLFMVTVFAISLINGDAVWAAMFAAILTIIIGLPLSEVVADYWFGSPAPHVEQPRLRVDLVDLIERDQ